MEFIAGRLYFVLESMYDEIFQAEDMLLNLDDMYQHTRVRKHFGPPSLKVIWRHCDDIDSRLKRCARLVVITNDMNDNLNIEQRTLSSFLMAAYAVLKLNWDAQKANAILLAKISVRLAFFRDYHGDSSYKLNILDCLSGLQIGCKVNKWFTTYASTKFPQATNSHLDMDWIVPHQFLALKDPTIKRDKEARGVSKTILKELKRCGIKVIVRLNGKDHTKSIEYYGHSYNAIDLKQAHFYHYDIPFEDVSIPSSVQANQFVSLCERFGGKIAVHCHAGLGRTATMIGCYLIKHHGFDSRSVCGWLKLCRRGSVMGPQHFYLDKYQKDNENVCYSRTRTLETKIVSAERESPRAPKVLKPKLYRTPKKNDIIHIVASNPRAMRDNSMLKYNIDSNTQYDKFCKTAILSKFQVTTRSPSRRAAGKQSSQNKERTHPTRAFHHPTSNITRTLTSKDISPRPKKCRKQIVTPCSTRTCYVNLTNIALGDSDRSKRLRGQMQDQPMNKRISKSHETIRPSICSVNSGSLLGSHSLGVWGGKMADSLFSQSKAKIYSLINSVYSKQENSR